MSEEAAIGGGNEFSDQNWREACAGEGVAGLALLLGGNERRHAEPAIERAQHFRFLEVANRGKPGKNSWRRESVEIKRDGEPLIDHARQIVGIAAAGDVGEREYACVA